jgi:hypothetical protein
MRSGRLGKVDRRDEGEKRWSGRMETSWKGKKSLLSIIVLALPYGVAGGGPQLGELRTITGISASLGLYAFDGSE